MKKFVAFFLLFVLIPLNTSAISASKAIVMDLNSGRVLYDLNKDDAQLIASITKIMTCLITIMYSDLEKTVVVDEDVLKSYGSSVYLEVGEEIKLLDLLYGLMLRSGNDAATQIAKTVAGSEEAFVYLMNEYAATIGMNNTHFVNPHGLDSNGVGNTSTCYDMALLTKVAMQNETFRTIFGTKSYTAKSNLKTYNWEGKNKLFSMYSYTTGGKTGYTDKARRTLVTTASKDNKNLVIVTLDDGNDFNDHKSLYETYFNQYNSVLAINKENFKIEEDYYDDISFYVKNNYYALVKKEEEKDLKLHITLYRYQKVYDDMKIGEVKVMLKDTILHRENIYAKKKEVVKEEKESFWSKLLRWFSSW